MKVRERSAVAIEGARRLLASLGVLRPEELDVELVAAALDAFVIWRELSGNEEGHILRGDRASIVHVRAALRGTTKGRFVVAHEIGHHVLHSEVDHFAQCTAEGVASGSRFRIEREASDFASELLVPTFMAEDMCVRASLADVLALAKRFDVSFTVAALRFLDMTAAPCAFVETRAGRVKRASGTLAFRGEAIRGRVFEPPADCAVETLPVEGTDVVLAWLTQ